MVIGKCSMSNAIQTVSKHVQAADTILGTLEEDSKVPPVNRKFLTNSNS